MNLSHPVLKSIDRTPLAARFRSGLPRAGERHAVGGIVGSSGTALIATLYATHPRRIFVLLAPDPGAAGETEADLESLLGGGVAHLFPQYESRTRAREDGDPRIDALRVEAVEALQEGRRRRAHLPLGGEIGGEQRCRAAAAPLDLLQHRVAAFLVAADAHHASPPLREAERRHPADARVRAGDEADPAAHVSAVRHGVSGSGSRKRLQAAEARA